MLWLPYQELYLWMHVKRGIIRFLAIMNGVNFDEVRHNLKTNAKYVCQVKDIILKNICNLQTE